jgi:hypothetical protein
MSERINQLKNQASLWCDENIPEQFSEEINGYGKAWEDKFAELIVKECIGQCNIAAVRNTQHGDSKEANGCFSAKDRIKEHFGVEE